MVMIEEGNEGESERLHIFEEEEETSISNSDSHPRIDTAGVVSRVRNHSKGMET